MNENAEHSPDREALLFNSAVRLLGRQGFRDVEFDIGGKKSRRRHIRATMPGGDELVAWVKAAVRWPDGSEVIRFPWKKLHGSPAGEQIVAVACDEAAQRGATHLLAVAGDAGDGTLTVARLYPLAELPALASRQEDAVNSVFYRAHRGSFVLVSHSDELRQAAAIAESQGLDLLVFVPPRAQPSDSQTSLKTGAVRAYARSPKVRAAVLKVAAGRCECCGELGFLTEAGEYYLETHHVVGVAERGPDSEANIVALCPKCHRMAHYSAEKLVVERRLLEALRRRPRARNGS